MSPPDPSTDALPAAAHVEAPAESTRAKTRLLLLAALLAGIFVAGKATGAVDRIDIPMLQATIREAGAWGAVVFVLCFAGGVLIQVPGMLFIATGMLVYGKVLGYLVSLIGAVVAVCASFSMVRLIGGQPLGRVERPRLRRLLDRLHESPIKWLVLVRLVALTSPPLNYALALSKMRFRDYAIGSALGLVVPMAVVAVFFDWLFASEWVRALLF